MTIRVGTAKAFGPDAQVHGSPQDRQEARRSMAMAVGNRPAAAVTGGADDGTLNGEDERAIGGDLGLQDLHLGNVERN